MVLLLSQEAAVTPWARSLNFVAHSTVEELKELIVVTHLRQSFICGRNSMNLTAAVDYDVCNKNIIL